MSELIDLNEANDSNAGSLPENPLDNREVQIAAGQYAHTLKQIKGVAKNMKAGGLARVLVAVAGFPYADTYPKFRNKTESELFFLFLSNAKAKGVVSEALKTEQNVMENLAVEKVTNEILKPLTKGVENNGNVD